MKEETNYLSVGKNMRKATSKYSMQDKNIVLFNHLIKALSMLWCYGWCDVYDTRISGPRLSTGIAVLNRFENLGFNKEE